MTPLHRLLLLLAGSTLLAFMALGAPWTLTPLALRHVALAMGMLPLILAAMLYFTPTLTRTGPLSRRELLPPLLALAGGAVAVAALHLSLLLVLPAVLLAGGAALWELVWMERRARRALGGAHPGLRWYQLSLACLSAALLAIALGVLQPDWWPLTRAFHLHLNLLGFVGLAALGTLQVLLPTVAGYADPAIPRRLRQDLWPTLAGALLVAAGAAHAWPPLAWLGALLWLWSPLRLLQGAVRGWPWATPQPALPLAGALLGFMALLLAGAWPAAPYHHPGGPLLPAFLVGVLLPLLTGALTHLLPLWRWPGAPSPPQTACKALLTRFALTRLLAFWSLAAALLLELPWAMPAAALLLAAFLLQALHALLRPITP